MKKNTIIMMFVMCIVMISYCSEAQANDINIETVSEHLDSKYNQISEHKKFNNKVFEKEENKINYNVESKNTKQESGRWLLEEGKWYYIDTFGKKIKNRTHLIDGKTYIFGYDGAMINDFGRIFLGDMSTFYRYAMYYGNGDGTVKTSQWMYINEHWFYFGEDGKAYENGAYKIDGKVYLFDYQSTIIYGHSGLVTINGNYYYVNRDGTAKTSQWIYINDNWFYFGEDGKAYENGIYEIGERLYLFKSDSTLCEDLGWMKIEDSYRFNGQIYTDIYWFYGNGDGTVKTSQWILDSGAWYYVDENGVMLENCTYEENNKLYVFDGSGAMVAKQGWIKIDHWRAGLTWLYGNGDGTVKTSQWLYLGGVWYYIYESGAMATGWLNLNGIWYYLNSSGAMKTGWLNLNGTWYYMYDSGKMATNTTIDGWKIGSNGVATKIK